MLQKPTWMSQQQYAEVIKLHEQACRLCGDVHDLTIDHIIPRWQGGKDELDNYQILCGRCNSSKGPRDDPYWRREFYFDQVPHLEKYRGFQRLFVFDKILDCADWFQRSWSQISRRLYVVSAVTGAGKTLGIPAVAHALNFVRRRENGSASRRVDKMLILTKEQSIRDQTVDDLQQDITKLGILPEAPRVNAVKKYSQLQNPASLELADIWVSCIHMLYEKSGKPHNDLEKVLAHFPLICLDEPHFASEQVLKVVDAATISLCFGFTGTPIDAKGDGLQRFVLFSLYGYDEAILYDHSLKYLTQEQQRLPEIITTVGLEEADYLEQGETRTTTEIDPQHSKNLATARTVAERVLHYIWDCDQLASAESTPVLAAHRVASDIPDLHYPMHGILCVDRIAMAQPLADFLNDKFEQDPKRYPRHRGWYAEVVHSEYENMDGQRSHAKPIKPDHPWLRYKARHTLDASCSRILIVIGIGREGLNHPYCGVYGLTAQISSLVFIVQATIGRTLRAVTENRVTSDGHYEFHVPTARLDMPRFFTHVAAQNEAIIGQGLHFVLNMRDYLEVLPTMDDLRRDEVALPIPSIEPEVLFTPRERYSIATAIGRAKQANRPVNQEEIAAPWQGASERKRERVHQWIELVDQLPRDAAQHLLHETELSPAYIVTRELSTAEPTDAMLQDYIRREKPKLTHYLADLATFRPLLVELYQDFVRQFHLGRIQATTELSTLQRQFAAQVLALVGTSYEGDRRACYAGVAVAMKQILDVPRTQKMTNGSQWDRAECHVMLMRDEVRREILGFTIHWLIRKGHCPPLAAAFQVPLDDSMDAAEMEDADAPTN